MLIIDGVWGVGVTIWMWAKNLESNETPSEIFGYSIVIMRILFLIFKRNVCVEYQQVAASLD